MNKPQSSIYRIGLWVFHALVATILVADAIAKPIYKPVIAWAANLKVMAALEAQIRRMPRFAVLLLFAVPFAVAEPLKLYALVLMASGYFLVGLVLLVLSYLITFILVERIYHAGRDKLLTYGWFSWCMSHVSFVREKAIAIRDQVSAEAKRVFGSFWKSPPRQ
ncbi:hypothetical protein [Rhizobium sp. MHM7A]|uniref:hypothetical protein n=1 Tax=Rhizobium sp. MHM7A TaxID=2583233 RepID=UPI001105EA9B|nr:hypothetical protein [Rhizobium sp. MHM7A]TLX16159.1 hypothetical protein FFR93_02200 [Rhizobium sp. MHM7A]